MLRTYEVGTYKVENKEWVLNQLPGLLVDPNLYGGYSSPPMLETVPISWYVFHLSSSFELFFIHKTCRQAFLFYLCFMFGIFGIFRLFFLGFYRFMVCFMLDLESIMLQASKVALRFFICFRVCFLQICFSLCSAFIWIFPIVDIVFFFLLLPYPFFRSVFPFSFIKSSFFCFICLLHQKLNWFSSNGITHVNSFTPLFANSF